MKSELIVDVQQTEVSIALLEDSRLVSLQKEARNLSYAVGDIYLAKVKKLMPGLNAAFVNVGYEKDAFLHYLDLGPHYASYQAYVSQLLGEDRRRVPAIEKMKLLPDIDKQGAISSTLTQGQELLVQIVKEPISSKGPRLTTEITFTGRFMVLIPFSDKISISQKIKSTEEKLRLRQLIESIKPKNFGVIIRTSAEGKRVAELINELKTLVSCWEATVAKAQKATSPSLIFEEESRIVGMLRDVFSPSFESIHVNDADVHSQIEKYVSLIAPDRKDIVKLYSKPEPIFDHFAITRQIKSSFGKTVSFRSGAYIIIESTEALHVIDVNSGNRSRAANDQESNALEVNLRAADEIARQLRLRDMGGIIVVDFIDMNKGEHRQQLYDHMREIMANDRARHNILPLSKFGLMQITRQRVRPALDITTTEKCPSCFGKGEVQPSLLFTDTLFEKLDYLINTLAVRNFIMYVHPYVDAYIKRGLFTSLYGKWRRKLGRCFKILPDQSLAYLQYRVLDENRNEIDLKAEKDMNAPSADKVNNRLSKRSDIADDDDQCQCESDAPATPSESKSAKARRRKRAKKAAAEAAALAAAEATAAEAGNADIADEAEEVKEVNVEESSAPTVADVEIDANPVELSVETTEELSSDTDVAPKAPKKAKKSRPKTAKKPKTEDSAPIVTEENISESTDDLAEDASSEPSVSTKPARKPRKKRQSKPAAEPTESVETATDAMVATDTPSLPSVDVSETQPQPRSESNEE